MYTVYSVKYNIHVAVIFALYTAEPDRPASQSYGLGGPSLLHPSLPLPLIQMILNIIQHFSFHVFTVALYHTYVW